MTEVVVEDLGGVKMKIGIDVGGVITPGVNATPEQTKQVFDMISEFIFRKDDIMLCTYQKTGTHWLFEILNMINNKSAKFTDFGKSRCMLEIIPQPMLDQLPSPRVMNSHLSPRLLPKDLKESKIKTILCLRNPKDTAVSYYHHMRGLKKYDYDGTFANWLPVFLQGKVEYGKITDYLLEWEETLAAGTGFPLHIVYFEDLKLHGKRELERLLNFLEVELDDQLKKDIVDACGFQKMAKDTAVCPKELVDKIFKKDFSMFRKGEIGNWKEWFTIADNEIFDEVWNKEMKDSKSFQFKYEA